MRSILIALMLLGSVSAWSDSKITPIKSNECKIASTPSYSPFTPRPVEGSVITGRPAELMYLTISVDEKSVKTEEQDHFLEPVQKVSRRIGLDEQIDPEYPKDGCKRSAALDVVCYKSQSSGLKCADMCSYSYHCVDSRSY